MTFRFVTALSLVLTVVDNALLSFKTQYRNNEPWIWSLNSASVFSSASDMASFGRPSHDQMEVRWSLVSSFLQFSITCFWKLLGSRRYEAPQAVSCWLEANLPASAIFLQVLWLVWLFLEPWPQQLSEQKSSVAFVLKTAISSVEVWGYFFLSKWCCFPKCFWR